MTSQPVLHLTVGLPGAGKTTLAPHHWASERWPTLPRLDLAEDAGLTPPGQAG
ncbi:hypothetical protein [Nocardioides sp.]|uniref:hypothetical protein n=1 Tax=Nocardioides sp. TaxID=35761 RepID=UPI0035B4BF0F